MKIFLLILLFLFCGCQRETYTLSSYIEDTKELFLIENEIETKGDFNKALYCQDLADILLAIAHESSEEYLYALGCINQDMYEKNIALSKQEATRINHMIYDDLYDKEYYETTFDIGDIIQLEDSVDLSILSPGIYEKDGYFYEVKEGGEVHAYDVEKVEIESTFIPDLKNSIILPEGSEATAEQTSFQTSRGLEQLSSRYFKFKLKDYTVSGRVQTDGVQIKVSKKTKNDVSVENELSLDNLKCTVDFSLEKKEFYFRADYTLKDTLSVSKTKTIKQNKVSLDSFKNLKEKIVALRNVAPLVEDELHLLTFAFEIPHTGKLVKVIMDLSLKLMVNGEVEITFSSNHSQGSQSFQSSINHLNQQQWEIKPYIEGNIECASTLNFALNLGNLAIGNLTLQGGIGAEATGKIHYVDIKKKLVETTSEAIDLQTMEQLLDNYDLLQEKYVDICADVNIYYFGRIQANQTSSLLRTLGLYGSITPVKNNFSLLHIEDHHVVDGCTKSEILFNPSMEIDAFDISNYQLYLNIGKSIQLTSSKKDCVFSSSNPQVVNVDQNGKVTALSVGYATIIVKDVEGNERHCLVFVQEETTVSSFSFT